DALVSEANLNWNADLFLNTDGVYTIIARVVDEAGNQGPASNSRSFTLDAVPTQVATISGLRDNLGIITGAIDNGGLTNDSTPTISGTLSAALGTSEVLKIFRDGVAVGNATLNSATLAWSYTPTTALSTSGNTVFTAAVVDGVGNVGPLSGPWSMVLDVTAPTQTVTIINVSDDTDPQRGLVAAGGRTNDTTPTIGGTISAPLNDGETLKLYNGSTFLADAIVHDTELVWSAVLPLSANGTYTITARVVDEAGNQGPSSASRVLILDTVAPGQIVSISGISDNLGTVQGQVADGGLTDDITPTLTGSLTAPLGTSEVLTIYRNGVAAGNAVVNSTSLTWSYTPATALAINRTYVFTAAVVDGAGNIGSLSSPRSMVLDTTASAPTLTLAADTGASSSDRNTSNATINVAGLEPGATWQYSTNSGSTWTTGTGTSFTVLAGSYSSGVVRVRQTDVAGNLSSATTSFAAFTVDTTAPGTTAEVDAIIDNVGTVTGKITSGGVTDDTNLEVRGTLGSTTAGASLASGESLRIYDGSLWLGNAIVTRVTGGQSTWVYVDSRTLANGQVVNYTARVSDLAGNLSNAGANYGATVITVVLNIGNLVDSNVAENSSYISATPTLTGAQGAVSWTLEGEDANKFTVNASTGVVSMVARDFETPVDNGANNTYSYTLKATDSDGNSATKAVVVNVTNVNEPSTLTISNLVDSSIAENSAYTSTTPSLTGALGVVTWTLEGEDANKFTVNASTGVVSMVARDFETPVDNGANNTY
ncbi:MAG: Ig-like domain repeat protein, partial [Pirellula sp.]